VVFFLSYVCHQFRCRSSSQIHFSVLSSLFVSYLLSPYVSPSSLCNPQAEAASSLLLLGNWRMRICMLLRSL
jgi:hypothetical protein